ncbi:MAG: hypothetical protein U0521_13075 [Anaerolineae bacterium]
MTDPSTSQLLSPLLLRGSASLFQQLRGAGCDVYMNVSAFNDRDEIDLAQLTRGRIFWS